VALQRSDMVGFSRGLHTDSLGVDGALLEAQDVVITREGELRKRGGKANISAYAGGVGIDGLVDAASAPSVGVLAVFADATTARRVAVRPEGSSSFTQLGTNRAGTDDFGPVAGAFQHSAFRSLFVHNGEILSAGENPAAAPIRWAGSKKSVYSTGTVSTTSGSTTVTGAGTLWLANLEAGMYLYINSGTLNRRTFRIVSVDTNTTLTVDKAPDATVAGASYAGSPLGAISSPDGIFGAYHYPLGAAGCSHMGRVFIGNTYEGTVKGERVRWSATATESSGKFIGVDYWSANAYTDVGVGTGGDIVALASVGADLVVFKQSAIYALRGAVATDGSDLGARVDLVSAAHGLLNWSGHCPSKIGHVFCDGRGAFVYSGDGIRSLTSGRVQRYWDANMGDWTRVSAVGDRLIFTTQDSSTAHMVYDISSDTWTTQASWYSYGRVVQTYTSAGEIEYEMGFRDRSDGVDDWAGDFSTTLAVDAGVAFAPDMQVVTHPIPLTSPVGNARPVRVDVNGFATDDAELAVSLIPGRQGGTEHAVGTLPAGTSDKSHRLRVPPGASLNPYYQVKIAASGTMSDARVYGVSILSAPSGRVDV
jgi:hypothetical protein